MIQLFDIPAFTGVTQTSDGFKDSLAAAFTGAWLLLLKLSARGIQTCLMWSMSSNMHNLN